MISQVRTALTRKEHLCLWCPVESKQLDSHCSLWLIFSNFSHLKVRCWNQNAFSGLPLQLKMERCAPPAGQLDGTALGHYHRRRWLQLVMFFSTEHRGSLDESLDLRHRCWMCLLVWMLGIGTAGILRYMFFCTKAAYRTGGSYWPQNFSCRKHKHVLCGRLTGRKAPLPSFKVISLGVFSTNSLRWTSVCVQVLWHDILAVVPGAK